MKFLYITIIALFALGFSSVANSQSTYPRDITLSWTWPILYTDATEIQDGDLRGGDLYCFRNQDTVPVVDTVPVIIEGLPGSAQETTFVGAIPQPGKYRCFLTAVTVDELSSDFSNEAFKRFTGKPLPPQNFAPDGAP